MEGDGIRLKMETDVGCLGQRKGEAARRKMREKQSNLRGIPEDTSREKGNKRKRKEISGGGFF